MEQSTKRFPVRPADVAVVLGIILLAAVFFSPQLFFGKILITTNMAKWAPWRDSAPIELLRKPAFSPDYAWSYYPRRVLLAEAWRDRRLPLWNPYAFCGTPLLADVQAGAFYPPNWLLLGLHPAKQFSPFLMLQMALGGIGLFLLLRDLF